MRLSELRTGEKAVVVKVLGHGGFRKRIVEEVLLNAPLQDPVKYKILGYEISLRRDEAQMIEVVSEDEAKLIDTPNDETKDNDATNTLATNTERGDIPSTTATDKGISEEKMQPFG